MRHEFLHLAAFLLITSGLNAQVLAPSWVATMGSNGTDRGVALTLDGTHVYLTGLFNGTVDFDPGPRVVDLTSAGGNDIYVTKFTMEGDLVWARRMGGPHYDAPLSIAVDDQGNVYTTGGFSGTADFDPGPGTFTMTAATTGQADIYISKFDPDGNFVWAKGIVGGTWWDQGYSMAIDHEGNVVVAGRFYYQGGPRDFDPGPGVHLLTAGHEDIFVLKLTNDGDFIWAVNFGTAPHESRAHSLVLDDEGNIYTSGYFRGTVDFDPGPGTANLTSVGTWNVFYHKLDPNGNFVWVRSIPITTTTYHTEPRGYGRKITLDHQGHLYATGRFSGTIDFDPGPGTASMTAVGDHDIHVLKFTTDGDLVWARSMGGTGYDEGFGIAADADGVVHVVGIFQGTADLDPGPEVHQVVAAGNDEMFVLSLDDGGAFIRAGIMGGTGADQANALVLDDAGDLYVTGWFASTADLDPGPGTQNHTSNGGPDVFLMKVIEFDGTNIGVMAPPSGLRVHPNPASERIIVQLDPDMIGRRGVVEVFNAAGARMHMDRVGDLVPMWSLELPADWTDGLYLLTLRSEGAPLRSARIVLQR
ncbi:MAG: SBBP repeat-containing protein [Flavobacteriales bacterium]|nr:SBBP repeat-containing protein [Flavobacteriales bacterium]